MFFYDWTYIIIFPALILSLLAQALVSGTFSKYSKVLSRRGITARQLGPESDLIRNITLFSVLIYELVGPVLTKQALTKAGDIRPMPDAVKNRREEKLAQLK